MVFFVLQAVDITFEDGFIALARRVAGMSESRFTRLLGYIWVYAFLVLILPIWTTGYKQDYYTHSVKYTFDKCKIPYNIHIRTINEPSRENF